MSIRTKSVLLLLVLGVACRERTAFESSDVVGVWRVDYRDAKETDTFFPDGTVRQDYVASAERKTHVGRGSVVGDGLQLNDYVWFHRDLAGPSDAVVLIEKNWRGDLVVRLGEEYELKKLGAPN